MCHRAVLDGRVCGWASAVRCLRCWVAPAAPGNLLESWGGWRAGLSALAPPLLHPVPGRVRLVQLHGGGLTCAIFLEGSSHPPSPQNSSFKDRLVPAPFRSLSPRYPPRASAASAASSQGRVLGGVEERIANWLQRSRVFVRMATLWAKKSPRLADG